MATKRLHLIDDDGNKISLDAVFERIADEHSSRFKDILTREFRKMVTQGTGEGLVSTSHGDGEAAKAGSDKTARKRNSDLLYLLTVCSCVALDSF